ncbi:unnamed protein product [Spirodela intermedia]|uniref:rRNA biogenesis protein RRP5 n=1 Tax=Spirodela intermedia TaxID=51605 RepID=A0A7I8KNT6_SPIIN|nr:unnamed protein product [Spirodela intermedia]
MPNKGKAKGKKENRFKSTSGKEATRDALAPRRPAASMKKQSRKKTERHPDASALSMEPNFIAAQDEEPDFPRGGASLLTREEEAEARAEADEEFMRELKTGNKNKQGKKKRDKGRVPGSLSEPEDMWGSLFGEGIGGKLPRFANRVTLKNVSPNMKLWGVVSEVNTKDLVISLPGGLRGFVRAEEVLDIIPDDKLKDSENSFLFSVFHVGQLVPCIVLQTDEDKRGGKVHKRIWLSLRLSCLQKSLSLDSLQVGMVLTAQVKSIEDHGCILHFGFSSVSGFLPQNSEGFRMFKTGQLLQGVVKSIDKTRGAVILDSEPELVTNSILQDLKGLSIDQLVPGMMVNAQVHATLENGVMLSFLTYFKGTVDIFHLQNSFPSASWKDEYPQHKKVNARILFIDPSTRAIGLTLNRHLILNRAPPPYVKTGDIYDTAKIIRVDMGIGLLLEIPSTPASSPAYVSIFEAADEVQKLDKRFKEGGHVRVRILGTRNVEGMAMGTLKAGAFEGSVFTHSDVKPGMLVTAKVIAVDSFGAIVQFSSGVKALCPLPHMSEFEIVKPSKKFQVGAELIFRVLGCKSKRITVTHKKTLVKSKLPVIASYADASEGLITHGWITNIENHGCFVRFYNGVQGFAHRLLGLEPGVEANAVYHIGQVMKCRIVSSSHVLRRISISFVLSPKRVAHDVSIKLGSIVSGVVERLTPGAVIINVKADGYVKGKLYDEHLSDHQWHASLMKSLLKPGYEFDELLVLDNGDSSNLILSAKYSLINCSQELPSELANVHPDSVIHGYICNVIKNGCFVRFLGRLTGFCSQNKVSDEHISDPSDAFYVGQSVRSYVINVNNETERIALSLKQSSCFSRDPTFLHSYFLMEKKIAKLQIQKSINSGLMEADKFSVGSFVEGEVQDLKDYGVVLGFKDHDAVGFVSQYQLGGRMVEKGSRVKALVLDISLSDNLVDLSLKEGFLSKKRRRESFMDLQLHQTVEGIVEIVKENYMVLSIPACNYAIGFASIIDYNTQKLPCSNFVNGQSVSATVAALPGPSTLGRLLLLLKSMSAVSELSSKRAQEGSSYSVGSLVDAEITEIKPLEVHLNLGGSCRGRIHVTEVFDDKVSMENPFSSLRVGQILRARIVAKNQHSIKSRKGGRWELSLRPSLLAELEEPHDSPTVEESKFSVGEIVMGYVVKVESEWLRLTVSRQFMAKMFILDTSSEPNELMEFENRYHVGQPVSGRVLSISEPKKLLWVTSLRSSDSNSGSAVSLDNPKESVSGDSGTEHMHEGDIVGGRIKKILPGVGGIFVQIGPHLCGRVHFTELTDQWISDPLSGYTEGQFVKCKVLEISRLMSVHVDLSLRPSLLSPGSPLSVEGQDSLDSAYKRFADTKELQPNMPVQGYIKGVTPKGCFVTLSRKIDARILISNLSDGYVEKPEVEFHVGKLINGKVLSVDVSSKRVDLTLKSEAGTGPSKCSLSDFKGLHVGDVISGKIKRIEPYGLFITIANSNMVGLCHISELPDTNSEDIRTKYMVGDSASAKILKVDIERRRLSLGMKNIDSEDDNSAPTVSQIDEKETGSSDNGLVIMQQNSSLTSTDDIYGELSTAACPNLEQVKTRAYVPPLEVVFDDDNDDSDVDNGLRGSQEAVSDQSLASKKSSRQLKRREREEREAEISASEQRRLQQDVPRTEDEFERLVRSSPNSSFLWIKYMAFMLSLADVEKARSIAERALKTINIRDEDEKLNIWVAYFNLENEYGNPPEDAVKKMFKRALQYCDPKKLHLALLGMYERTDQHKLADELLEKMVKKFKNSCKVWLHRLQSFLRQQKEGVQSVVNRALLSLPRKKHIKFISQAAIQEFKFGEPDRGRSMLEGVLREYPKRTDLWSIYLDQEIRLGDVDVTRALFERATCLSLPPKKMKFLFKKYLQFEKSLGGGGGERVEYVKNKALEYVESSQA